MSNRKRGLKYEDFVRRRLGGRLTIGSGIKIGDKGDITFRLSGIRPFRGEIKCTSKASYSLKHETLCKIAYEAQQEGEIPAFFVGFTTEDESPKKFGSWAMVPLDVLARLVEGKNE